MKTDGGNISRFLLLLGVFAPVMMLVVILSLSRLTPDYDPISESISQMGAPGRPYAAVLNGGYAVYGFLMALAAHGLCRNISSPNTAKKAAVLLAIHIIFTPLLGVFPDTPDIPGKHLIDDFIHNAISAISYVPVMIGILVFRKAAGGEKALRIAGIVGLAVVAINLPMPLISILGPLKPIGGLLQRLLAGGSSLWVASVFLLLYQKLCRLARETCTVSAPVVLGAS